VRRRIFGVGRSSSIKRMLVSVSMVIPTRRLLDVRRRHAHMMTGTKVSKTQSVTGVANTAIKSGCISSCVLGLEQ
jgi:hypothetical protein